MYARARSNETLLLTVTAALLLVGITMVYSSTFVIAHNNPAYGNESYFLARQLGWAALGVAAMVVAARIDYRHWRRLSVGVFVLALAGLVVVLVPHLGRTEFGAQRWLAVGPLPAFQPSEFAKLAVAVYFADWLSRKGHRVRDLAYGTLPFAIVLGVVVGLVLLQPDLGTTLVLVAIAVAIYFTGGANLLHFVAGVGIGLAGLYVAVTGAGYRSQRLAAFLDPESDPLGIGWHIIQAQIALGSGGLFGRGLGASRQKFYYLPSAPTDTIFAIIGEELGFIGAVVVILLFALLAYCGARIALQSRDAFGMLLATGIATWLTVQALINVAVVAGVLPFTGIPLPLVSLGGSSLVISLVAVGLLLSIDRQNAARARRAQE
ncbi:MAG: putative lipid II flippase FtsW [Chloroflexi bacterium]|nr:putative lipid II flippase FtsW [Chloroflexota bacterium]